MTDAMAASPPKPRVSAEQRRALRLLAGSRHGVNAALLVHGHGFKRRVLAGLIRRKLTAAEREVAMAGGKTIEVVRIRITAAGRKAVGGDRAQFCAGDNTSLGLTGR